MRHLNHRLRFHDNPQNVDAANVAWPDWGPAAMLRLPLSPPGVWRQQNGVGAWGRHVFAPAGSSEKVTQAFSKKFQFSENAECHPGLPNTR